MLPLDIKAECNSDFAHMMISEATDRMMTMETAAAASHQGRVTSTAERFLMQAPGVSAQEFIRPETQSALVRLDQRRSSLNHQHFKVNVNKYQELVSSPASSIWPLAMEVAGECRQQNVECSLVASSPSSASSSSSSSSPPINSSSVSLVFTTIRPIEKGQRLYFWFSETLLAKLEMPFLIPQNIQGGERYVCHRCTATFTTPNPLKLHLFFQQCTGSSSTLNASLAYSVQRHLHQSNTLPALWSSVLHILTISNSNGNGNRMPSLLNLRPSQSSILHHHPHHHHFLTPFIGTHPRIRPESTIANRHPAAQVETLVSHLGRSKNGHVCIYCGKIYSRKYGLKIHIRTHTGYKPLKCPVCSRPFGDPSNLNKHIRLHSEHNQSMNADSPYRCEICGKVLVRRRDLERHIQSRHSSPIDSHRLQSTSSADSSIDCCPSPSSSGGESRSSIGLEDDDERRSDGEEDDDVIIDIC